MHEETADKFFSGNRHHFPSVTVLVIPPFEGDISILDTQNAVVGNGNPMCISAQIFHYTGGGFERRLAVANPILFVAAVKKPLKITGVFQILLLTKEAELRLPQVMQEFSSEKPRQHSDRDEKLLAGISPTAQLIQPAAGDNTVDMGMIAKILPPGMQNRSKTKSGTEIFLVSGKLLERLSYCFEEQII